MSFIKTIRFQSPTPTMGRKPDHRSYLRFHVVQLLNLLKLVLLRSIQETLYMTCRLVYRSQTHPQNAPTEENFHYFGTLSTTPKLWLIEQNMACLSLRSSNFRNPNFHQAKELNMNLFYHLQFYLRTMNTHYTWPLNLVNFSPRLTLSMSPI